MGGGITRELHPFCDMQMADTFRAIAQASLLILDGGSDLTRLAQPDGGQVAC